MVSQIKLNNLAGKLTSQEILEYAEEFDLHVRKKAKKADKLETMVSLMEERFSSMTKADIIQFCHSYDIPVRKKDVKSDMIHTAMWGWLHMIEAAIVNRDRESHVL